jgi:hypothetical protein
VTTEAAREIELSTKQQATAVEQVNAAIADVAQTTKENESSSNQTALDGIAARESLPRPQPLHPIAGERVDMAEDPYRYFRDRGRSSSGAQPGRPEIEQGAPTKEIVARLLRLAHTLKEPPGCQTVRDRRPAHAVEDSLGRMKEAETSSGNQRDSPAPRRRRRGSQPGFRCRRNGAFPPGATARSLSRPSAWELEEMDALVESVTETTIHSACARRRPRGAFANPKAGGAASG